MDNNYGNKHRLTPEEEQWLSETNPDFLSMLDDDPAGARERLSLFLYYLIFHKWRNVLLRPTNPLYRLDEYEFENFWNRLAEYCSGRRSRRAVRHCKADPKCEEECMHDFCVLRRYEPRGKPFAGYLYTIAYRKVADWYHERRKKEPPDEDYRKIMEEVRSSKSKSERESEFAARYRRSRELPEGADENTRMRTEIRDTPETKYEHTSEPATEGIENPERIAGIPGHRDVYGETELECRDAGSKPGRNCGVLLNLVEKGGDVHDIKGLMDEYEDVPATKIYEDIRACRKKYEECMRKKEARRKLRRQAERSKRS